MAKSIICKKKYIQMWQMQIVENLATVKEAVKKKKAYWLYHTFVCFTAEKPPQTL